MPAALHYVEGFWVALERVAPSEPLVKYAGALADTLGLRGYDAVHLASFEAMNDGEAAFVAADGDLIRAAADRGHHTIPLGR